MSTPVEITICFHYTKIDDYLRKEEKNGVYICSFQLYTYKINKQHRTKPFFDPDIVLVENINKFVGIDFLFHLRPFHNGHVLFYNYLP